MMGLHFASRGCNCIKIVNVCHKSRIGLIQLSSPLGIKFPYKNSVVTNRLIPECATLFHLASRLCRYHYRRYRFSFVYGHQLSQPYER